MVMLDLHYNILIIYLFIYFCGAGV
jgi:hypothetical protein